MIIGCILACIFGHFLLSVLVDVQIVNKLDHSRAQGFVLPAV